MELLNNLDEWVKVFLENIGFWGPVLACLLIIVESILPVLPLCVFITLLFLHFGNLIGFLISWICTCIGCYISYTLVKKGLSDWFIKKVEDGNEKGKLKKIIKKVDKMEVSSLAVLIAIPFTPAFLINIACGLTKMKKKKFITAILIGKLFMVYFWGYIGTTLIECLKHPEYLFRIVFMVIIAYALSKLANRYLKID